MNVRMTVPQAGNNFFVLGAGGLLSMLWWGLALKSDPLWKAHLWQSLIITLGGFVLALFVLALIRAKTASHPDQNSGKHTTTWLMLSLLYPIALLGLFVWKSNGPHPASLSSLLIHPIILTLNLAASLLVGTLLKPVQSHLNKGIVMAAWWLWHLPFIFINGSALLQQNFSNLLMFLYLATVLSLSFLLSWFPADKIQQK